MNSFFLRKRERGTTLSLFYKLHILTLQNSFKKSYEISIQSCNFLFIYFNPIIYFQFSFSIHSIRGFAVVFKNKIILVSLNFFFLKKTLFLELLMAKSKKLLQDIKE